MKRLLHKTLPRAACYLCFGIGALLAIRGVWMVSHPVAYIVGGLLLAAGGFLASIAPDPLGPDGDW